MRSTTSTSVFIACIIAICGAALALHTPRALPVSRFHATCTRGHSRVWQPRRHTHRLFAEEGESKEVVQQGPAPAPKQAAQAKPEVSDSMRQKLLREARATGADPDVSTGNPILLIMVVVGVLVILGGKGIFY